MLSSETSKVKRIGHVAIRVEDIQRAKSFYLNLGMKLVWDDQDWCYLEAGEGKDGLALLGPGYKSAGPHFAFHFTERTELELLHARLKESEIEVGSIHEHRDQTASFYVRDPEGNWLEMLYHPSSGIATNVD